MGQLVLSELRRIAPGAMSDVAHSIELQGDPVKVFSSRNCDRSLFH